MLSGSNKPMSFAVIIPCWDARGVANIRNSEFARVIIETEPRDDETARFHQHSGPAPAQLIVLQNDAGAAAWPVTKKLREEFLQAFRNKRARRNSDASAEEGLPEAQEGSAEGQAAEGDEQATTQAESAAAVQQDGKKKKKRKLPATEDRNAEQASEAVTEQPHMHMQQTEAPTPAKPRLKAAKKVLLKKLGSGATKRKPLRRR